MTVRRRNIGAKYIIGMYDANVLCYDETSVSGMEYKHEWLAACTA